MKSYDHLIFSSASVVYFRASKYIIALNRTSVPKVVAIWICFALSCLISSISIHYAPELNNRVKRYVHLNFSRAFVVLFRASQYIIGLMQTSEPKVIAVWICLALWCFISNVSIYYMPELDIWVKSYDHMNLPRASVVQFRESRYIICLDLTSESKVVVVWICLMLPCLIASISIYYDPESDIRLKSYGCLNFPYASMFNFERLDILLAWIVHPSQKLWPFEFSLCFHV